MPLLRSGISELDRLLDLSRPFGLELREEVPRTTAPNAASPDTDAGPGSIAIIGPDGTGKSVIGLHYAAHYFVATRAHEYTLPPVVLYVSTDLRTAMARRIWNRFQLEFPNGRELPCERTSDRKRRIESSALPGGDERIALAELRPDGDSMVTFLEKNDAVGFLDLATFSAGDDWGYLSRILATLPTPPSPHLVVIDSVAGFETLIGNRDAYGEKATRRSRIAQIVRASDLRSHLIFIGEEATDGSRLPEEFIVDTVVRLRRRSDDGKIRRTLEIEKARGAGHATGEHPYEIRDGQGSSTGIWENPDDPQTSAWEFPDATSPTSTPVAATVTIAGKESPAPDASAPSPSDPRPSAYVQIFPTLEHRTSRVKVRTGVSKPKDPGGVLPLGIPQLDDLLPSAAARGGAEAEPDPLVRGLPKGRVSSLIGDAGTGKSAIAHSFLCEAFREYAFSLVSIAHEIESLFARGGSRSVDGARATRTQTAGLVLTEAAERVLNWRRALPLEGEARASLPQQMQSVLGGTGEGDRYDTAIELVRVFMTLDMERREALSNPKLVDRAWYLESQFCEWATQQWLTQVDADLARSVDDQGRAHPAGVLRRLQYPFGWDIGREEVFAMSPLAIADWILRHPANVRPAVFIGTRDINGEELVDQFTSWLIEELASEGEISGEEETREVQSAVNLYVAQHLIFRHLDVNRATSAGLFHVIEWCAMEAQRLVLGPVLPKSQTERFRYSNGIPVVLDDYRILRDMYPAVRDDTLFLPFLIQYLEREGFTSLIVDTDSGRPGTEPTDNTDRELRSLVAQQIYTWPVQFFGQSRIAITTVPADSTEKLGIVRELIVNPFTGERSAPRSRVRWQMSGRPVVNPHFELYAGLEDGNPSPVGLEVRLFAETPGFVDYVAQEQTFFRQMFSADSRLGDGTQVVFGGSGLEYDALRDFCQMPADLRLNHSLIFQVDNYWNQRREGSLLPLFRYLSESTTDPRHSRFVDPFQLFQPIGDPTPLDDVYPEDDTAGTDEPEIDDDEKNEKFEYDKDLIAEQDGTGRIGYFANSHYQHRVWLKKDPDDASNWQAEKQRIDRVPFTWDFAFLLCDASAWNVSAAVALPQLSRRRREVIARCQVPDEEKLAMDEGTVASVFNHLPQAWGAREHTSTDDPKARKEQHPTYLDDRIPDLPKHFRLGTWRAFAEAARVTAERASHVDEKPVAPLAIAATSSEAMSCLVFEIWFSEILLTLKQRNDFPTKQLLLRWLSAPTYREPTRNSGVDDDRLIDLTELIAGRKQETSVARSFANLIASAKDRRLTPDEVREHVPGFALELYRTWLLLLELLDFTPAEEGSVVNMRAVATRHWYKTACTATASPNSTHYAALQLPGNFTTRGDWHLAAAKGSRSARLAERALDILSSRRANLARLSLGLGLPVRDILPGKNSRILRTALRLPDEKGAINNVTYEELCDHLGGQHPGHPKCENFYWLWRGGLANYDRQCRPFRKWLQRLFSWTTAYKQTRRNGWDGGFIAYDEMVLGEFDRVGDYESFMHFARMCDRLVAELGASVTSTSLK